MRSLIIIVSLLCSASAFAQDAFPRCVLTPEASRAFHEHYGKARVHTLKGQHDKAQSALEAALILCVDAEVLLRLAENARMRLDEKSAQKYQRAYDAQIALEKRIARSLTNTVPQPRGWNLEESPDTIYLDNSTSPHKLVMGQRPSRTPLYIETTPATDATILLRDARGNTTHAHPGKPIKLPAGRYTLTISAPGWNTTTRDIQVSGRKALRMIFVLSRAR